MLQRHIELWNWKEISKNISINTIITNPILPWNILALSCNKNITYQDIELLNETIKHEVPNEWQYTSLSTHINIDIIRSNLGMRWCKYWMSWNKGLTIEDIVELDLKLNNTSGYWNWDIISRHIIPEEILKHPEYKWQLENLIKNERMTYEVMCKLGYNREYLIDYINNTNYFGFSSIIHNPKLIWFGEPTYDIICKTFPNISKTTYGLEILSETLNIKEIALHHEVRWKDRYLSRNKTLTVEYIKNNINRRWNWKQISMNISMDEIRRNPLMPWCKEGLSYNTGLTLRDIELLSYDRWDILMRNIFPMTWNNMAYQDIKIQCI